jgi:hypothetical protein
MSKLLLVICSTVFLTSCQKEAGFDDQNDGPGNGGNPANSNIIGEYDFVGLVVNTEAISTVSVPPDILKGVTTSFYTTVNNTGTVKITATNFISTGIGYEIHSTAHGITYLNGDLEMEFDFPMDAVVPPANGSSPYTRITSDSLTMTGGLGVPDASGMVPTATVGQKYRWSGDTLLFTTNATTTHTVIDNGVPAVVNDKVSVISRLKKR